jgi:hypothetical protein
MEPMFTPIVGQRVRVVGADDNFIVIRVDRRRHHADLMHMAGALRLETSVPLFAIRPKPEATPDSEHGPAIRQTKESSTFALVSKHRAR